MQKEAIPKSSSLLAEKEAVDRAAKASVVGDVRHLLLNE